MIPESNSVILGDCIEVMEKMTGGCLDLIVTDPPYLISYKTGHRKDKTHDFNTEIMNDDNPKLIEYYITNCYESLKNNKAMYMFCSADKVDFFKKSIEDRYFNIKNMIVWIKNNWTAGDLKHAYGRQYEICFYANKGQCDINGKRITDVWKFDRVSGNQQLHQNQKPVDLIKQCILKSSQEGDLVFDGFGGSGTTAIACLETNRKYILVEKDPKYYEMTLKRIEEWKSNHKGIEQKEIPKEEIKVVDNPDFKVSCKDCDIPTHTTEGQDDFHLPSFIK